LKLDKLIKDSKLVERLDKLDPDNASGSKNDGINYWKGKKIVTMADWKKKIGRNDKPFQEGIEDQRLKEALQYFPDDYENSLFAFVVPQELMELAKKWEDHYLELMQFRNNSKCGRSLCFNCLLCPDKEERVNVVGISRLIARAVEVNNEKKEEDEKEQGRNYDSDTVTNTESLYPCSVLNRLKCPYDKKEMQKKSRHKQQVRNQGQGEEEEDDSNSFDVDYLFSLSTCSFMAELAFIKGRKDKSIKNIEDVYNALTDRDTLDKLLQRELDEEQLKDKDEVLEFFMSIKDYVRIEDLTFYNPSNI
jgi:hypothetical protein